MADVKQVALVITPKDAAHPTLSSRLFVVVLDQVVQGQQLVQWSNFTISSTLINILGQIDSIVPEAKTPAAGQYINPQDGLVHERDVVEVVDILFLSVAEALARYPGSVLRNFG